MEAPNVLTRATSPSRIALSTIVTTPMECDYDVRPTMLYKCIQNKAWHRCLQLLNHPEHASQAGIWVVRKETNGKLRWRLLPLHAALIFQAPSPVIEALLEAYPEAASAKDDQGMLPLHLALRNRPILWPTVEELLTAHPAGVYIQDRKGRTPLQGAASASNGGRIDDNSTVATNSTLEENNNCAALSVLQLYTQIAVAGERQRMETPTNTRFQEEETSKIHQLEQKHADSLKQFQRLLQKEKQQWKQQLENLRTDALVKEQHARAKESILLKELESLRQSSHGGTAQKAKACAHCHSRFSGPMSPSSSSPTTQDLRVLEVEQENATLKESIEDLLTQQDSMRRSMETLQTELQQAHDLHFQQIQSLTQSLQQSHASQQAHVAIWKGQLQQANKSVTHKLAQVGLTDASNDDDDDGDEPDGTKGGRTCLEQVEIDQDNDDSQTSSVVVVRVPKVFFRTTSDDDALSDHDKEKSKPTPYSRNDSRQAALVAAKHETRQDSAGPDKTKVHFQSMGK